MLNSSESKGKTDARLGEASRSRAFQARCREAGPSSAVPTPPKQLRRLEALLRRMELKITPQRVAVYKALIESEEHPSADMLWRKVRKTFPNISLDTVNRTLLTLAEIGAAFIVEGSGDVKRFDGRLENHQHFKCIKCKKIIDFHHKPFDNIPVPKGISGKYTVLRKTVYFEGICDLCRKHIHK